MKQGPSTLDERRKEAALDRPRRVLGNAIERVRLEHVDAGVDRVTVDLVRLGFFEKPLDVAAGVGLDQAVGGGILDRREHDRGLRSALAVQRDDRGEVHLRQHIAVEDDDRLAERFAGVAHRAGGAERRRLDDVANGQTSVPAVAEDLLDPARLIVEAENDLVDLRYLPEQVELIVEERPIEDRHDRFRRMDRQGTQPRAFAPRQQDRLHGQPPMISCAYP